MPDPRLAEPRQAWLPLTRLSLALDRRAGVLAASAASFRAVHVALRRTAECAPLRAALAGPGAGAALPFEVRYCTHTCLNYPNPNQRPKA